ncbi:MAG: alpha-ketoglutarate-dependent dioxygenase AlkB family protein [Agriterribacter sp.]
MMNILPFDGEAFLYKDIFSAGESDNYCMLLATNIAWKQEAITMFGKKVMQPRLTALYGDAGKAYRYSGITMHPLPWSRELMEIKIRVEELCGHKFSTALLNYYRNGQDSMGWHRDNEKELGKNPVIASVSFGAERIFQFRHHKEKSNVQSVLLTHGSLLLMQGTTQHCWYHQLPKTKVSMGERINITFRQIRD